MRLVDFIDLAILIVGVILIMGIATGVADLIGAASLSR